MDPSPGMLSSARNKVEEQGIGDRVDTVCGTVEDLSAERRFDAATSILVMHLIPDDGSKLEFLKEIRKRLNPGAPLVLMNMCGVAGSEEHKQKTAATRAHASRNGLSAEFLEDFESRVVAKAPFVPESRDVQLLNEAGFRVGFEFFRAFSLCGWIAFKA